MSLDTQSGYAVLEPSVLALRWPHLQRLLERWLRRWGFAISGWVVGLSGVWLAQTRVSEDHASALQAVERLHQQLAALPAGLSASPEKPLATEQQNMLKSLPVQARQGQIWVDLQQALTAGGLNLLSLRPLPPSLAQASAARLPSQVVAVRLSGRFEDWSRVWAAFTQAGPVCSIDRISLAATAHPEEVQIDAVLRVWLRPGDVGVQAQAEPEGAWDGLTWLEPSQSGRSGVILFAQARQTGAASGGDAMRLAESTNASATGASGVTAGAAVAVTVPVADALPEDPRQWPLARVRLTGLWQQGADRQAILSAGPHWVRVRQGQRVTQEGHRVAVITEAGVRLRLAQGPMFELTWGEWRDEPKDRAQR
jgi:Tfp pilus assembly protein PilO